jgi:cytosine permease
MTLERISGDHARAPVPAADQIPGVRMALLISNTVVCVPNFLIGTQIVAAAGMSHSLVAFFVGGLILALMTSVTAVVGARANLSTSMIIQFPFGQRGGRLVNLVLLATILGNYAVIAALFGRTLADALHATSGLDIPTWACTVFGSVAMVIVIIFGFRSLKTLAAVAVPALVLLIAMLLYSSFARSGSGELLNSGQPKIGTSAAISAVIGSYVIGAVVLPDMMRYVKSSAQGVLATSFSMALALPIFLSATALIAAATGAGNPTDAVLTLGLGTLALLILTFTSWTNNANNLYSSALIFAAVVPSLPQWRLVLIAGALGTILALLPVIGLYIAFLQTISILLPPLAGIYVADFFLARAQVYRLADLGPKDRIDFLTLGVWAAAAAIGGLAAAGVLHLTSVPGVDSMLIAFALQALKIHSSSAELR